MTYLPPTIAIGGLDGNLVACLLGENQIFTGFGLHQRGHTCLGNIKVSYSLNPQHFFGCIKPEDVKWSNHPATIPD
jgi:hypothetical protein